MKVLHTADIHLGVKFKSTNQSSHLRKELRHTFAKIIDLVLDKNIDLLLISGDLFDSPNPSSMLLEFVSSQFRRITIPICLIPGTHEGGLYTQLDTFRDIKNLTVFTDTEWGYKEYPELDTSVYGINAQEKHPLKRLSPKTDSKYHIAMLHASYLIPGKTEDDILVTKEEISSCGMNYIALGHWHNLFNCILKDCEKPTQGTIEAWYPGSPFPIAIDEDKAGNVILIEQMKPTAYKISPIRCEEIDIDISGICDLIELKQRITISASKALRRRVNIKGISSLTLGLDIKQLEEELSQEFSQLQLVDNSIIPTEELDPNTYNHRPFIKSFLELIKEDINTRAGDDRKIAEQALHYGLALLSGKEVL